MSDSDLMQLYSGRILELAGQIPHLGRLDTPDITVSRRAPRCGSSLIADVQIKDGRISALGLDVKACALGQAAAAVIARHAIGQDAATLTRLARELHAMLGDSGPVPSPPFEELKVLTPARSFTNRHGSITLLADALSEAVTANTATA